MAQDQALALRKEKEEEAPVSMALSIPEEKRLELLAGQQKQLDRLLGRLVLAQEVVRTVMKKDVHFGASFPGDKKVNLLKAGADALGVAFQIYPEFEEIVEELPGGHKNIKVHCIMKDQVSGVTVGMGVGSCSTMESKYRWRHAAIKCPACGKEAVISGNPQYAPREGGKTGPIKAGYERGGWLCWKKKDGCGTTFPNGDPSIEGQERGKVENQDPADQWNTVLKIAKKRAYVDGMITATGCSDYFTQDLEDLAAEERTAAAMAVSAPAAVPAAGAAEAGAPNEHEIMALINSATKAETLKAAWDLAVAGQKPRGVLDPDAMKRIKQAHDKKLGALPAPAQA